MVIDPRLLTPLPSSKVHKGQSPCARCGFDLRGLSRSTACPQCGLPGDAPEEIITGQAAATALNTSPPRPRPLTKIGQLKRTDKRRLAIGATLMSIGIAAYAGAMLVSWMTLFIRCNGWIDFVLRDAERIVTAATLLPVLPGAVLWAMGVWILVPSHPPAPKSKGEAEAIAFTLGGLVVDQASWWPGLVRVCGFAWLLPPLCILACNASGGAASESGGPWVWIGLASLVIALIMNGVVCEYMRQLSIVSHDDEAGNRFYQSVGVLPGAMVLTLILCTPGTLLIDGGCVALKGLFNALSLIFFFAGAGWGTFRFVAASFSIASTLRWSVTNEIDGVAKDQRFIDKSLAIEREFNERRARFEDF